MNRFAWRSRLRVPRLIPFGRRPTLEVHVPISPTSRFLYQLRCLTHSLRRFGGTYRDAPVIATVGSESVDEGLASRMPWLAANGIELRWVPAADFQAMGIFATGAARLKHDFRSDVVLLLDADTLIRRPLDDLIDEVFRAQVVAGVTASVSPFPHGKLDKADWVELYALFGLPEPRLEHEHPGWGYLVSDPRLRYCPPYFNYGVVAAPSEMLTRIGRAAEVFLARLREMTASVFDAQIAFTLAMSQLQVPVNVLPLRYNYANHPDFEALNPGELEHAIVLHLLWERQFSREGTFSSLEGLEAFVARPDLRLTNQLGQEVLRAILPALAAEERGVSLPASA